MKKGKVQAQSILVEGALILVYAEITVGQKSAKEDALQRQEVNE